MSTSPASPVSEDAPPSATSKVAVVRKDKERIAFVVDGVAITGEMYKDARKFAATLKSLRIDPYVCRIKGIAHEFDEFVACAKAKAMNKKDPSKPGGRYPKGKIVDIEDRLTRAKIAFMEAVAKVRQDMTKYKDARTARTKNEREKRGVDPDGPVTKKRKFDKSHNECDAQMDNIQKEEQEDRKMRDDAFARATLYAKHRAFKTEEERMLYIVKRGQKIYDSLVMQKGFAAAKHASLKYHEERAEMHGHSTTNGKWHLNAVSKLGSPGAPINEEEEEEEQDDDLVPLYTSAEIADMLKSRSADSEAEEEEDEDEEEDEEEEEEEDDEEEEEEEEEEDDEEEEEVEEE